MHKFRAWHRGNKNFIYATLSDIWRNGYQCRECMSKELEHVKMEEGIFTPNFKLDEIQRNSFIPTDAKWEVFIGLKDFMGNDIYVNDNMDQSKFANDDPCPFTVCFEDGAFRKKYPEWDETLQKPILDSAEIKLLHLVVVGNIHATDGPVKQFGEETDFEHDGDFYRVTKRYIKLIGIFNMCNIQSVR